MYENSFNFLLKNFLSVLFEIFVRLSAKERVREREREVKFFLFFFSPLLTAALLKNRYPNVLYVI